MRRLPVSFALSLLIHMALLLPVGLMLKISSRSNEAPLAGGKGVSVEIMSTPPSFSSSEGLSKQPNSLRPRAASSGSHEGEGSGSDGHGTNRTLAQIRQKIERAKRYPELARRSGIEGKSFVRFRINPSGQPVDVAIKNTSGSEILDQESLATIRRAAPYPSYDTPLEVAIRFEKNSH